jgi:N-acetyl-gamma-glutamyl-phosphate reductase
MVRVGVFGGSGYVGQELVRLLAHHPQVELSAIASESHAGLAVADVYPHLWATELQYCQPDPEQVAKESDVVFTALPHGHGMQVVPALLENGCKVIDLGADFRLKDHGQYALWYGLEHMSPELLGKAVYGLPELHREEIRGADLVANPGCYPTSVILALAPLIDKEWLQLDGLVIDAKSGVSGAGRSPSLKTHYAEVNESIKPYKVGSEHRHIPEIEQELTRIRGEELLVSFTPHLVPMTRGILASVYAPVKGVIRAEEIRETFTEFYSGESFVWVGPPGYCPSTKDVVGSNRAHIALEVDRRTNRLIVMSVIDNLVKGAAGQAVQNMNLMFGLEEGMGLAHLGLVP